MHPMQRKGLLIASLLATSAWLAGCGGAKNSTTDSASGTVVNGDVPIAYAKRSTTIRINPTGGAPSAAGGDLMLRELSSASATEHNLTARFTQGKGDASDPEVSYDGKKIVFAMRCPTSNTSTIDGQAACTGRWNIWEYDMSVGGLTNGSFRRITASTDSDDVDPAYLPAGGGFVFASNRQVKSSQDQGLGRAYKSLDEYEREAALNLHTMKADGTNIKQITFNVSHDRNPVVRPNGDIMFARWEHVADSNRFTIFRVKPDGTDQFVLYGEHSPGNSFLHPRDMDPKGKYAGQVLSSLMPLQRTQEGGALMLVDVANFSENGTPSNANVKSTIAQVQLTPDAKPLEIDRGLSRWGRVTTPYPLWDGTDRVLVAYRPCEVTKLGVVTPCAALTEEELASVGAEGMTAAQAASAPIQNNAPAAYGIYMFDPTKATWLSVAAPPQGFMYTDPVAIQARTEPASIPPTAVDADLEAQNMGLLEVRSIFDTDGLGRMGEVMFTASDLPEGCNAGIAMTTPSDALDTRAQVADLLRIKNPADPAYGCSPVRWVRAIRAIPPPAGMSGLRSALGETNFEGQQILGYAPVEPDGSFKIKVPADTAIALSIVDSQGRGFQTHTNWIQVRPGERRTCDGCHSPRRGASLNSGVVVNTMPATLRATIAGAHLSGETMASTRTRLDGSRMTVSDDPVYEDDWADTAQTGVRARPSVFLKYRGNPNSADDLATPAPVKGVINYPEHIQPLWERDRGANTCVNCHNDPAKLDLRGTMSGLGRLQSYQELLVGDPDIDPATGLPKTHLEDGVPVIDRLPSLVNTSSNDTNNVGQARKSRLMEILSGQSLLAGAGARAAHPNPPATAPDHSRLLNAAEKRLVAEWMDVGGQYYNNPFDANGVRTITGLSETVFEQQIVPILQSTCANGCHQAIGSDQQVVPGVSFRENRFVLTGDAEGDYGSTVSMVSDVCNPASNPLLARPSTMPHPAGATRQTTPVLSSTSAAYTTIANWIRSGCRQ